LNRPDPLDRKAKPALKVYQDPKGLKATVAKQVSANSWATVARMVGASGARASRTIW
jgi:hypothetical protein